MRDEEALAYRVGLATKGRFRTFNFGYHGYGPHQMLSALQEGLVAERTAGTKPKLAVYVAIVDHIRRAAGRALWTSHQPRFVPDDGDGVTRRDFYGTGEEPEPSGVARFLGNQLSKSKIAAAISRIGQGPDATTDDLYIRIVRTAGREFEKRFPGAEFHVVFWDVTDGARPELVDQLAKAWPRLHRLSEIVPDFAAHQMDYTIEHDGHPNAACIERIADWIAANVVR